MNEYKKIGVFDSGIGGVTVLKELVKILPKEEYIYYSDSKNNPYGDKEDDKLYLITKNIIEFFVKNDCKAVVIACNTATARMANKLRKKYPSLIIVGIEPAYKMIYDFEYNKSTLILATEGTIESEKFKLLYNKYNNGKTFVKPCVGLANLIENNEIKKVDNYLKEHLNSYIGKVDTVVLGCTHYPIIKENIKKILGNVEFVDGSYGLAKNLKNILDEKNLQRKIGKGGISFFDSSGEILKEERFYKIIDEK